MKFALTLSSLVIATCAVAADLPSKSDVSLLKEVARGQERGLDWLLKQQKPNGSWNDHPAVTGLAVMSILRSDKKLTKEEQAAADSGVKFVLTCVKPTGAIYGGGDNDKYPNYSTSICTLALQATGKTEYTDIIKKARAFLLGSQLDEDEKVESNNPSFGGIGYGSRGRPDLSNTGWALEAIRLTESLETEAGGPASKLH